MNERSEGIDQSNERGRSSVMPSDTVSTTDCSAEIKECVQALEMLATSNAMTTNAVCSGFRDPNDKSSNDDHSKPSGTSSTTDYSKLGARPKCFTFRQDCGSISSGRSGLENSALRSALPKYMSSNELLWSEDPYGHQSEPNTEEVASNSGGFNCSADDNEEPETFENILNEFASAERDQASDEPGSRCEFCNRPYNLDYLPLHRASCIDNPEVHEERTAIKLATEAEMVDQWRATAKDRTETNRWMEPDYRFGNFDIDPPEFKSSTGFSEDANNSGVQSELSDVMIPCEFCCELLPCDVVQYHQYYCVSRTT